LSSGSRFLFLSAVGIELEKEIFADGGSQVKPLAHPAKASAGRNPPVSPVSMRA